MRHLSLACLLCLGSNLLAGPPSELPEPGRDEAFRAQILPVASEGPVRPWHSYREPSLSASAVVEVVGQLTKEERRQMAIDEFLVWFRQDFHRFLREQFGVERVPDASGAPGDGARKIPLLRIGF